MQRWPVKWSAILGWACLGCAVAAVAWGAVAGWYLSAGTLAALATVLAARRLPSRAARPEPSAGRSEPAAPAASLATFSEAPTTTGELVEQMLRQSRYALLLRPEIMSNLSEAQRQRARDALDEGMALVPEGEVLVGFANRGPEESGDAPQAAAGISVRVEHFRLDRYPVTNRQYQAFVDGGGYEQLAIWDPEILPAVLDFVDQTGAPGPRFWRDGHYPEGQDEHPVVGVSWFEAAAYARWVGKRLPSDPEWEKAGCWPISIGGTLRAQRRFPWGDAMDRKRCNIWSSGPEQIVPVQAFPEGVSVGGVYQLIGNVWEWTSNNYGVWAVHRPELITTVALKSIRGGAYDTYFENQATCQFASGEDPVARKHNIGFRCALSTCDLALSAGEAEEAPLDEGPQAELVGSPPAEEPLEAAL